MLNLIEAPKDTIKKLSGKSDRLLDSGASYHMTGNLSLLHNSYTVSPIPVGMLNSAVALASKLGSVRLSDKLSLRDVLYIPSLNCNLISIAQLVDNICCSVMFTHKLCMIQHLTMKTLIGSSEHKRGSTSIKSI